MVVDLSKSATRYTWSDLDDISVLELICAAACFVVMAYWLVACFGACISGSWHFAPLIVRGRQLAHPTTLMISLVAAPFGISAIIRATTTTRTYGVRYAPMAVAIGAWNVAYVMVILVVAAIRIIAEISL